VGERSAMSEQRSHTGGTSAVPYRGFLIRSSPLYVKFWIERNNHFIGWAADAEQAKRQVDGLTDEAG